MQPIRTLVAHVRALPPRVFDAGLAALLLVDGLSELGLRDRVQAVVLAYESGVAIPGRGT